MKKILFFKENNNQSGATAILTTVLILSAVLSLALLLAGAVVKNLHLSFDFKSSVQAFYAADAAAEKCIYQARKAAGSCANEGGTTDISLSNGATAQAERISLTEIESLGSLRGTNRKIKITGNFTGVVVATIDPSAGVINTIVSNISITGAGFISDSEVWLKRDDDEILPSTPFTFAGESSLTGGAFDLTGVAIGYWDVLVSGKNGLIGILNDGFYISTMLVTSITPDNGNQGDTVNITSISGGGFLAGATARLEKGGETIYPSTPFTFISNSLLANGAFNLTGAHTGNWDVVVANPDSSTGVLSNGFEVTLLPPIMLSGVLAGLYDYPGRDVIVGDVDVIPYNGASYGWLEVRGETITVTGTINASGAGSGGGGGGGGGGNPGGSGGAGTVGGSNGNNGVSGTINYPQGGNGGAGGGSYGGSGGVSQASEPTRGGYAAFQVNGDSSTDETLKMGSGGGGGNGGYAGYIPQGGGGGGAGGKGGGYIKLYASQLITISGIINTTGNRTTGDGGAGGPSAGGVGGNASTSGSSAAGARYGGSAPGRAGAAGAGGGVLLKAPQIVIEGNSTVDARGGDSSTTNGGTVKIFYQQGNPSTSKVYAGRIYETTY